VQVWHGRGFPSLGTPWGLRGRNAKVAMHYVPGNVEWTPSSKLVSSTGNLSLNSLSVNVTGFLKYIDASTSR